MTPPMFGANSGGESDFHSSGNDASSAQDAVSAPHFREKSAQWPPATG